MTIDIRQNFRRVLDQIQQCPGYNENIKLIAVSKLKPVEDILQVYQQGHRLFGENRVQEARTKQQQLPSDVEFHLLGSLQSNKAKYCPGLFSTIHSLHNDKLANLLEQKCSEKNISLKVLIQMNLCNEDTKSGFTSYDQLLELANVVLQKKHLQLIGLMTIPDPHLSNQETSKIYDKLKQYQEKLASELHKPHQITELSMGTTQDFPIAIAAGATFIRLGTILFGQREPIANPV